MNSTTPDRCGIMNRVGRLVRDVPDGVHVQPVHGAEPLRGDLVGGGEELAAGVVDQHVEAPVALGHGVEQRVDLLGLAHVALDGQAVAAAPPRWRRASRRAAPGGGRRSRSTRPTPPARRRSHGRSRCRRPSPARPRRHWRSGPGSSASRRLEGLELGALDELRLVALDHVALVLVVEPGEQDAALEALADLADVFLEVLERVDARRPRRPRRRGAAAPWRSAG